MRNPIATATSRGSNAKDHDPKVGRLLIYLASEAIKVGQANDFNTKIIYGIKPEQLVSTLDGDQ